MTKMKKLFAVVLALAMLFTMASFSASAEEATITMTADGDVVTKEISVVINASDNVGGLTATLAYDKSSAQVVKEGEFVVIANAAEANLGKDTVKDNGDGTLSIVLLGQDLTIKFQALVTDKKSTFTLSNIKASNTDGTATLTVPENVTANVELTTVIAEGNTIRETSDPAKQDLGFVSTFIGAAVPEGATDVKLGFVALPTSMLGDADLTLETPSALKAEVIVDRDVIAAEDSTEFVAHIAGIVNSESRMGRKISGRFYVSYKVGSETKVVYSNNTNTDQNVGPIVNEGVVSKSFVGTCKAMAAVILTKDGVTYGEGEESLKTEGEVSDIITKTEATTLEEKKAILEFVVLNAGLLK